MAKTKLPKQWLHWAKKCGISPEWKRYSYAGFYMIGRGRRWRVNNLGQFECSCPTQYFDKWSNSRGAFTSVIPKTEAEFVLSVNRLREESASKR